MPHIIIETNNSLLEKIDPQKLCDVVHQAATDTQLFADSVGGIKVRVQGYSFYNNDHSKQDFVHCFAHILEGRTPEQKKSLSLAITNAVNKLTAETFIISTQICEMEKDSYTNKKMLEKGI